MKSLSRTDVIAIHDDLVDEFGGQKGIRDQSLLESALKRPFLTFEGNDLYPSVHEKAAVLATGIMHNHPFVDGNKRTAIAAAITFLEINDKKFESQNHDLVKIAMEVAHGEKNKDELSQWFKKHTQQK